jgi:hypothetical protein
MDNNELVIGKSTEFQDLDEDGARRTRIRVTFTVGKNGPFYEYFPVKDFDGAAARRTIEARAQQIRQLQQ